MVSILCRGRCHVLHTYYLDHIDRTVKQLTLNVQLRHEWSFTYSFIAFRSLDHVIITVHDITYRCVTPPPPPAQPALVPAYATVAAGLNLFSDKENMLYTTIWQHRYSVYDLRATWIPNVQSQRILALKKQFTKHVVQGNLVEYSCMPNK